MQSALTKLGDYTLIAEIARGGMGVVYLAQTTTKKLVVVKLLRPDLAEDEKLRTMFLDEARLSARLKHRNIVQTEQLGQDGGRYFFVMEYLEGRTLQSVNRLKGERALPAPMILRVACDVLAGLHYAHEVTDVDGAPLGLVHRDVSPHNVFLTYDGQVKLLDFGVAKAFGRQQTEAGVLRGRVSCMAPDHLGEEPIDRRADVFAVGVLLREALTGKRVWEGRSEVEILRELLGKRIPPLPADAPIAPELRVILEKAMEADRNERYRTAHAMRAALEQYVIRIDKAGSLSKMGGIVSREFAEHRAHARAVIEQHIAGSQNGAGTTLEVPVLPVSASELPVGASPSVIPEKGSIPSLGVPSIDEGNQSQPKIRMPSVTPRPREAPPRPREAAPPAEPARALAVEPQRRSSVLILAIIAGLTFAAMVVAIIFYVRAARELERHDVSPIAATKPSATEHGASVDPLALSVDASPPGAQIIVDDVMVQGNPWRGTFPRGSRHTIRVVAAGHATKSESVTMTETANLSVALEPVDAVASARPPATAVPPRAEEPSPATAVRAAAPRRPAQPAQSVDAPAAHAAPPSAAAPPPPPPAASADVSERGTPPKRAPDPTAPYE
jgi:eukaryotic-like serine/threonine-protein kinase